MVRKLFGVLMVALVLCFGAVMADDFMGTIKSFDAKAKKITITDKDGNDKEFTYTGDTKLTKAARGKKGEDPPPATAITVDDLNTAITAAKDKGGRGVGVKVTTKDAKSTVATGIELRGGGGRRGGGGQ